MCSTCTEYLVLRSPHSRLPNGKLARGSEFSCLLVVSSSCIPPHVSIASLHDFGGMLLQL